jgi:hypothetical protein
VILDAPSLAAKPDLLQGFLGFGITAQPSQASQMAGATAAKSFATTGTTGLRIGPGTIKDFATMFALARELALVINGVAGSESRSPFSVLVRGPFSFCHSCAILRPI